MKKQLRTEKLLERLSHHPMEKSVKDAKIIRRIGLLAAFKRASTVMFYLPIKGEVDLKKLLQNTAPGNNSSCPGSKKTAWSFTI